MFRVFRSSPWRSFAVVTAVLATPLAAASPASAQGPGLVSTYIVELSDVDGSGAGGTATLTASGSDIRIEVTADGTSAGRQHPVALHRSSDEAARCPRPSDDRNDDGFVTGTELTRVTGDAALAVTISGSTESSGLFDLAQAPQADGTGQLLVDRSLTPGDLDIDELGSLRLVIYGNDLNFSNRYEGASALRPAEVSLPVACGEVRLRSIDISAPYASASGAAGTVTRLYVSILQRSPEPSGHDYFVSEIESGASSIDVVWAMASSPEFTSRFGPKLGESTGAWVDFVYRSIFGRRADTPGRQYWISQIDRGGLEREAMLFYFAESAEFKTTTATS